MEPHYPGKSWILLCLSLIAWNAADGQVVGAGGGQPGLHVYLAGPISLIGFRSWDLNQRLCAVFPCFGRVFLSGEIEWRKSLD